MSQLIELLDREVGDLVLDIAEVVTQGEVVRSCEAKGIILYGRYVLQGLDQGINALLVLLLIGSCVCLENLNQIVEFLALVPDHKVAYGFLTCADKLSNILAEVLYCIFAHSKCKMGT